MVGIFLILRSGKVAEGLNTEITEVHLFAVDLQPGRHYLLQSRAYGRQIAVSAQQCILDLLLIFFYLGVGHSILLVIGQRLIAFGRICIIQLIHLIDDGIVILQEALDHIVDAVYVILSSHYDVLCGLFHGRDGQSIDGEYIGVALILRIIQRDLRILCIDLVGTCAVQTQALKYVITDLIGCGNAEIVAFSGILGTDIESLLRLIKVGIQSGFF